MKAREYFRSGGSAFRGVIVSKEVREAVAAAGVRGLRFEPQCTGGEPNVV